MDTTAFRIAVRSSLAVAFLLLTALQTVTTAQQQLSFGALPVNSGEPIFDSELARMIADNMPLDSDILLSFDQCYAGQWIENFNSIVGESSAPGANFDPYSFTNTSVVTPVVAGVSVTDGFNAAFNQDLKPGTGETISDLVNANLSKAWSGQLPPPDNRIIIQTPKVYGETDKTIGGMNSTHVLLYAGILRNNGVNDPTFDDSISDINTLIRGHFKTCFC